MKVNWQLFVGLSVFYVIMTVIYWYVGGEAVGVTGMLLAACLAGMVGFYVWFTQKRIGTVITVIALAALVISVIGWVTEYEKPLDDPSMTAHH
jgi:uncharacterized membrane protein YhdT